MDINSYTNKRPSYLDWHYQIAPHEILRIISTYQEFIYNYFSVSFLTKTLFTPFKRTYQPTTHPGLNLQQIFDRISFNIVSRIMGFIIRGSIILTGVIMYIFVIVIGIIFLFIWLLTPGIWFKIYLNIYKKTLCEKILEKPNDQEAVRQMMTSPFGNFLILRTGIHLDTLISCAGNGQSIKTIGKTKLISPSVSNFFLYLYLNNKIINNAFERIDIFNEDIQFLLEWYGKIEAYQENLNKFWHRDYLLRIPSIGRSWCFGYTPVIDNLTHDLSTEPIPFGQFHGRKKEIESIERILTKMSASNALIIGDPGVGKHPLIIHFAHEVAAGHVSRELEGKRILKLETERVFGSTVSSQERKAILSFLLDEADRAGNIILVIDDFDRFVSSGQDRMDLTEVFVHYLSHASTHIIAISATQEYYQYINGNSVILNVFEKLEMLPVDKKETLKILCEIIPSFEINNRYYTYQTLREIVDISERYIKDKPYPYRAIHILDTVNSTNIGNKNHPYLITPDDIRSIVSALLKIPITLTQQEKKVLLSLEQKLHLRVIGQNEAISAVASAIRRNRTDISAKKSKPIGSFLFLGPTGVGKTETAKALAESMFGSDLHLARFDMSEFQEDEAFMKFLGDFSTGKVGIFTTTIRKTPYTVVLLDEFEKANPRLLNIFLAALDEGFITDSFGDKVFLDNTIIIATSNAGAEYIRQLITNEPNMKHSDLHAHVLNYVQEQHIFSPELINRFDTVVVFQPLNHTQTEEILNIFLSRLNASLSANKKITVELSPSSKETILREGFDPIYGGRALSRAIQKYIEDPLALKILSSKVEKNNTIVI